MPMAKQGLVKMSEECHELQIELGKLGRLAMKAAATEKEIHWDGTDLKQAMQEEMGDVLATMRFVADQKGIDWKKVKERSRIKYQKYLSWNKGKD